MLARTLILGVAALLLGGCGITGNFRNDPGYADFDALRGLDAESDFGLSLGPLPLKIAGLVLDEDDEEELKPLLRDLRAVRVYTLEGLADAEAVSTGVEQLTAQLTDDGWLNVIAVREEDELTSVFLRPGRDFAHRGLAVIVQEPDEVVLVNLIGNVRLDLFNGYMAEADVDVPAIEIDPNTLQAHLVSDPASPAAGVDP
jgi:hypothetical protein